MSTNKKPTRVWKPLDVGGLRLYKVKVRYFAKGLSHSVADIHIVAARSPSNAADIVRRQYEGTEWSEGTVPSISGHALNVLMPADWWENGVPACE